MTSNKLAKTKLFLMDVDGVLTDGSIVYPGEAGQSMAFNVKDGLGLKMLHEAGILTGVITGRKSAALTRRLRELTIGLCYDGVSDKASLLESILIETGCSAEETAFIADDLPDIPLMRIVGIPIAVADARPEVRLCAAMTTEAPGGKGAVREACEAILKARGCWPDIVKKWS